jgi:predicted RNA binding protein YcfA (HicA-like mRNA interferase family)
MTPRLRVKGKDLISALQRAGFEVTRTKGSHHFLRHSDGRATTVPVHTGETIGQDFCPRFSETQRFRVMISRSSSKGKRPNTSFQRTRARGGRGPGPLNSNR